MVFGRPETLTTALATARHQIARTEAEGALFDLNAQAIERPLRRLQADAATGVAPRAIVWSAKVPAFLLRNPRISNCAALVATND